jgi:hypothetical protein
MAKSYIKEIKVGLRMWGFCHGALRTRLFVMLSSFDPELVEGEKRTKHKSGATQGDRVFYSTQRSKLFK